MTATAINWADMPLFAGKTAGLPYQRHSRTSILAAGKARNNSQTGEMRVLHVLSQHPEGLTDMEIYQLSGLRQESTVRARRIGLVAKGKVKLVSQEGKSPLGNAANKWGVV